MERVTQPSQPLGTEESWLAILTNISLEFKAPWCTVLTLLGRLAWAWSAVLPPSILPGHCMHKWHPSHCPCQACFPAGPLTSWLETQRKRGTESSVSSQYIPVTTSQLGPSLLLPSGRQQHQASNQPLNKGTFGRQLHKP